MSKNTTEKRGQRRHLRRFYFRDASTPTLAKRVDGRAAHDLCAGMAGAPDVIGFGDALVSAHEKRPEAKTERSQIPGDGFLAS
jgi:hypothetical protein